MCVEYVSFRCHSDEDLAKLGISSSSIALSPMQTASSPLHGMSPPSSLRDAMLGQLNSNSTHDQTADVSMTSVLEYLKTSRKVLHSQIDEVYELKVCTSISLLISVL